MNKTTLQFIGSGDAFASSGKFNTCFYVTTPKHRFLIDCGASSLVALKKEKIALNSIEAIFVTHFHGDHFGGLPFFILDAHLVQKRTNPLTIVGPQDVEARVKNLMEAMFHGSSTVPIRFDLNFIEAADFEKIKLIDLEATYYPVVHAPGSCPHGIRFKIEEQILAYTGDTEWTDHLIPLADGADLIIVECYNYNSETKFHMSYSKLLMHGSSLNSGKIMVTHLGDEMFDHLDDLEFEVCYDGQKVEL